jgi:hypothetical protein
MGKVVLCSTVSVDGFIADEQDQPGPLFDWLSSGDVPLDETGQLTVSQASYDHTRAYRDEIGVTIVGRHVFDLTDGWGGTPPGEIDHVVVLSHRPAPRPSWIDSEGPGRRGPKRHQAKSLEATSSPRGRSRTDVHPHARLKRSAMRDGIHRQAGDAGLASSGRPAVSDARKRCGGRRRWWPPHRRA